MKGLAEFWALVERDLVCEVNAVENAKLDGWREFWALSEPDWDLVCELKAVENARLDRPTHFWGLVTGLWSNLRLQCC